MNEYIKYRCNGCGWNYNEPFYCDHCGSPQCPECKRTGCISNLVELERMVSHSIPEGKPKRTNIKKRTPKKPISVDDLLSKGSNWLTSNAD
jgi:hypothetical protein